LLAWLLVLGGSAFSQGRLDIDRLELRSATLLTSDGERDVLLPDDWRQSGRFGQKAYRLEFAWPTVPEEAWAVYIPRVGNRFHVSLNGQPVARAGPLGDHQVNHAHRPHIFPLLKGSVRAGINHLDLIVEGDLYRYAGLSRVHVGAERLLQRDFLVRNAVQYGGSLAVVAICTVFSMLAFALYATMRQKEDLFFALAGLFFVVRIGYTVVERVPFDYRLGAWLADASYACMVVCIALFCVRALKVKASLWNWAASGFGVCSMVMVSWSVSASRNDIRQVWVTAMLAFVVLMTVVLVIHWYRQRGATSALLAVAAMGGLVLGARDHWVVFYSNDGYGSLATARYGALLFILAMSWIIVDRLIERMREEKRLRQSLARDLEVKKQELTNQYELHAKVIAEQAQIKERERLVQDLHDGMGLQLNSLLGLVERERVDHGELQKEVRHSIEQLRALVDGSEKFDGTLAELLGQIRYRLETRLQRQGIALQWHAELSQWADVQVEPLFALSFQYLLYEMGTNVIKHSGATLVRFTCGVAGSDVPSHRLQILFSDDGVSPQQDRNWQGGRLRSIDRRINELGAQHQLVQLGTGGWEHRLSLSLTVLARVSTP
jgi:signal transduction histidine kinase